MTPHVILELKLVSSLTKNLSFVGLSYYNFGMSFYPFSNPCVQQPCGCILRLGMRFKTLICIIML